MKKNDIENFRRILSRLGLYVDNYNLDQVFGLVGGFDAASEPSILEGFREWLLEKHPQCDEPFGWTILVTQILPKELKGRDAVDAFVDLLTKFLDTKNS
jgi:hypothetical protein